MRKRKLLATTVFSIAALFATVAPASAAGNNSGTFRCGSAGVRTFLRSTGDFYHAVNNSGVYGRLPAGVHYTQLDWRDTSGSWVVATNGTYYGGGAICR